MKYLFEVFKGVLRYNNEFGYLTSNYIEINIFRLPSPRVWGETPSKWVTIVAFPFINELNGIARF